MEQRFLRRICILSSKSCYKRIKWIPEKVWWFDSKKNGKMATSLTVRRQHQRGVAHFPLEN